LSLGDLSRLMPVGGQSVGLNTMMDYIGFATPKAQSERDFGRSQVWTT